MNKLISFQIEIDPRSPRKRMMCNSFAIRRDAVKGFVRLDFAMVEGDIISDEFVAYGLWSQVLRNKDSFLQFADQLPGDDGQSQDLLKYNRTLAPEIVDYIGVASFSWELAIGLPKVKPNLNFFNENQNLCSSLQLLLGISHFWHDR